VEVAIVNYDDRAGRSFRPWRYRDEVCCFGMSVIAPTAALYVFGGLSEAVVVLVIGTSGFAGGAMYMARRQAQRK
jgi:hypothetical protein